MYDEFVSTRLLSTDREDLLSIAAEIQMISECQQLRRTGAKHVHPTGSKARRVIIGANYLSR